MGKSGGGDVDDRNVKEIPRMVCDGHNNTIKMYRPKQMI